FAWLDAVKGFDMYKASFTMRAHPNQPAIPASLRSFDEVAGAYVMNQGDHTDVVLNFMKALPGWQLSESLTISPELVLNLGWGSEAPKRMQVNVSFAAIGTFESVDYCKEYVRKDA